MKTETTLINFVNKIPISFSVVHFDTIFPHVHAKTQLLLVLDGKCSFQIGDKNYEGSTNDMVVINPGVFHRITSKKGATIISVIIDTKGFSFEGEETEEILFSLNTMDVKNNPRYNTIRYLVFSIIAYNTMENINSIYTNRAIAYSFFAQLVNDFRMTAIDKNTPLGESLDTINRVNAYVNEHYKERITLNFLAKTFNYSASYLSRLYTSTFGESFISVYDKIRVNYSLGDLLQGNKTIQQIAEEHGFEEVRSYLRAFKKIHDMTPNEYRQKYHRSNVGGVKLDSKILRKQALDKVLSQYEQYGSPDAHKESAPRATEIQLPIDIKGKKTPLLYAQHKILEVVTPTDLVNENIVTLLDTAKEEIRFDYLLVPHLFTRQNRLLIQNEENQWALNYVGLQQIIERILSFGALPYFVFEYNENLLTMGEYYALVTQIFRYLYGAFRSRLSGTMVSFSFPRDKTHYTSPVSPNAFALLQTLTESAKKIVPSWKIGSPVFLREDIEAKPDYYAYLKRVMGTDLEPDFIAIRYQNESSQNGFLTKSRHPVREFLDTLRKNGGYIPGKMFFQGMGFTSDPSLLNDTLYASSFLLQNFLENYDSLVSFSPTALCDRDLYNAYDPNPYQGKEGLFTYDHIKKSAYTSYAFLSKLEKDVLKVGEHYIATIGDNRIAILINNYNHYSDLFADREYFEISNLNRYSCFPKSQNLNYKLSINGLSHESYRVKISSLGRESGSSYDRWLEMGGVKLMRDDEKETLKELSQIHYSLRQEILVGDHLDLTVSVAPLEAALIEIEFN